METEQGTYILVLRSSDEQTVQVGALGTLTVTPGVYAYVGSAFGPGGVRARVQRHARAGGATYWHVDYLRSVTTVDEVWYTHDSERRECLWVSVLRNGMGASIPITGFGASDCKCPAHLVSFESRPRMTSFRAAVRDCTPTHAPIRYIQGTDVTDG